MLIVNDDLSCAPLSLSLAFAMLPGERSTVQKLLGVISKSKAVTIMGIQNDLKGKALSLPLYPVKDMLYIQRALHMYMMVINRPRVVPYFL